MEKITIRESSVGQFALELQAKIKEGFVISEEASEYPWIDQQYNAVMLRGIEIYKPTQEQQEELTEAPKPRGRKPNGQEK